MAGGVLSLSRREQIRAATETKFSERVMKSVARQRNKMTLLLSGEFTDRVEAHNTVEVKFGIKPGKKKQKQDE